MFVFPFIEQETAWLGWSHHAGWHVTVKKCLCALMSQNGSCFDALCQIRSQKTTQKGLNLYETAGTRSGMTGENIKKTGGFMVREFTRFAICTSQKKRHARDAEQAVSKKA